MDAHPESMMVEMIRYNNWANAQLLAVCEALPAEQLSASAPGVYGTIHRTLGHIVHAEADYVGRLTGSEPHPPFDWHSGPSVSEIRAFADVVAAALLDMIRRVPPDHMVHEEEDGNTLDYRASALFIQIINHGIEHRTNITTILSGLGLPAPEIDGWGYLVAHGESFALKETFADGPNADH